jgi:CRP/FNR family transcriptional regulator, cyclic AMP receptor protein
MEESKFSKNIVRENYKAGDFIFSEGEIGFHFYIIESGEVHIFTKNQSGHHIVVAKLESGESFGEFALLDKQPRSASAQAITPATVVKVSPEGYEELLADLPIWAVSMLKSFARRMKHTTHLLQQIPQFLPRE